MATHLTMKGGCGDDSYARNSEIQRTYISCSVPVLEKALLELCRDPDLPPALTIADMGCSSGPNSLRAVYTCIKVVYMECRRLERPPPEFCVLLNDLPLNDFNTVFRSLPEFHRRMREEMGSGFGPCFVIGVPGSFYGRLFPRGSLNFVVSSTSLHWLSRVPEEMTNTRDLEFINKGKVYLSKSSPRGVFQAYEKQFRRDFHAFLESRGEEMADRGRMVVTMGGRRTPDPAADESCLLWDYLGEAFQSLVREGLIEESKLDSYNTPYYRPYIEDLKELIETEGSFHVVGVEIVAAPWDAVNGDRKCDRKETSETTAKAMRAVQESMLVAHFGDSVLDPLFERFTQIMAADWKEVEHVSLVLSLVRNPRP
ncbi:hypothetical protein MLD38_031685 [Melastoma candidum]|uniref:Uncharacterized protein n=1 Tax=Melastoma candidum TaxID=119954 RepID=A0ACB9MQG0_9MYRT|nr:hypothetical protein MLD38_031685 [Melastoma candidum]